jgi:hypothetical protein
MPACLPQAGSKGTSGHQILAESTIAAMTNHFRPPSSASSISSSELPAH